MVGNPSHDELSLNGLSIIKWFHNRDPLRGFPIHSGVHHLEFPSLDVCCKFFINFTDIIDQATILCWLTAYRDSLQAGPPN